ncbi:GtrA family protein [Roseibium sp.]|uniref:GtrA family protein n=1 Tax=Roseibium sp. TaxID=1936156 RepID=UPI003D1015FE
MISRFHSADVRGQLIRFVLVGAINTAFGYAIYTLGLFVGLPYWLASLIALLLGIAMSFFTQGKFVFRTSLTGRLPVFVAMWAVIYLANILLIRILAAWGANYYLAGALALIPVVILSFSLNRLVVFRVQK